MEEEERLPMEFYMKCSLAELAGFVKNMSRQELEIKFKESIIMLRDYKVPSQYPKPF